MRASIWAGLIATAIGLGFLYLAQGIAGVLAVGDKQGIAAGFALALFLLSSASFLGSGIALLLHWVSGFTKPWNALFIDLLCSVLVFLGGIVGAIISTSWIAGLHSVLTGFVACVFLISLSTIHLFGSILEGLTHIKKAVIKKWRKKKRR